MSSTSNKIVDAAPLSRLPQSRSRRSCTEDEGDPEFVSSSCTQISPFQTLKTGGNSLQDDEETEIASRLSQPQSKLKSASYIELDADLWASLPEPLLETILAWLPVPSLFLFRSVCKQWNSLIHSASFQSISAHIPAPKQAWFLFRGEGKECAAFDPSLARWCHIPLDYFPNRVRVVASAGGLLCGRRRDDRLYVCNPLTKAWVELPPKRHRWKYPIVGMVSMDGDDGLGYRVVVAGSNSARGKSLTTEVYDSSTKSWKSIGTRPVQHHFQTNAVYSNGSLYSAGFTAILAYNMKQEQWTEVDGPVMEHTQLMLPQICISHGSLLMVEVVTERFLMTRVSIWLLREASGPWIKITSMSPELLEEVIGLSGSRLFTYFGHDDLVLFTFARRRVLAYSIGENSWKWLPCCPFVRRFARRFATFAYKPRWSASG